LCWLVKLLRLFSLIACSFLPQATILNYCPKFGVHYT
jgi:hypothetical protein